MSLFKKYTETTEQRTIIVISVPVVIALVIMAIISIKVLLTFIGIIVYFVVAAYLIDKAFDWIQRGK